MDYGLFSLGDTWTNEEPGIDAVILKVDVCFLPMLSCLQYDHPSYYLVLGKYIKYNLRGSQMCRCLRKDAFNTSPCMNLIESEPKFEFSTFLPVTSISLEFVVIY